MLNSQQTRMPPVPPLPPPPPHPSSNNMSNIENGPKPSDGIPYIGSRISLISKTDIRYEGYLFNIDTRQSMVALQNVRSFGTEGRRIEHIPISDTILPFATFKASEIKDLHVCEAAPTAYPPKSPVRESHQVVTYDDEETDREIIKACAEITLSPARQPTQIVYENRTEQKVEVRNVRDPSSLAVGENNTIQRANEQEQASRYSSSNASSTKGLRTTPGMGGHLLKRKERRVNVDDKSSAIPTLSEFNFEQGLTEFDKEKELQKLTVDETRGSYQKSSFFDTISCDALDRLEGNSGRVSLQDERRLNTETFGAVGLNTGRRNYRSGRGRGGRGRGHRGGRGRGWRGGNREGRGGHRRSHNRDEYST